MTARNVDRSRLKVRTTMSGADLRCLSDDPTCTFHPQDLIRVAAEREAVLHMQEHPDHHIIMRTWKTHVLTLKAGQP